jgi:hypothetical protein
VATHIVIHFGHTKYEVSSDRLTGLELRRLFNLPADDLLYRQQGSKVEGDAIADNETVDLKNGDHFTSVPRDVTGGAGEMAVALPPRVAREVDAIVAEHKEKGPVRLRVEGNEVVVVVPLAAPGWIPDPLPVLFKIPTLYPDQRPDMIFLAGGARPPWGAIARHSGTVDIGGSQWEQVSWHLSTPSYDAQRDNLAGFIRSVEAKYLRSAAV